MLISQLIFHHSCPWPMTFICSKLCAMIVLPHISCVRIAIMWCGAPARVSQRDSSGQTRQDKTTKTSTSLAHVNQDINIVCACQPKQQHFSSLFPPHPPHPPQEKDIEHRKMSGRAAREPRTKNNCESTPHGVSSRSLRMALDRSSRRSNAAAENRSFLLCLILLF